MGRARLSYLASRFLGKAREAGFKEAVRFTLSRLTEDPRDRLPLRRADPAGLFASDPEAIMEQQRQGMRSNAMMLDASNVEASYPEVHEEGGRFLRYAFLPAAREARGLVVLFHGHDAFLHMGPMQAWDGFDVLAPWDTFGWRRRGSWFWGEKGDAFVEPLVRNLIARHRGDRPWFATGGSMGGFGALWHGIKYGADGIYVMCPQVDLAAKAAGEEDDDGPYRHLGDGPDLLGLAGGQETLPPLFLVQNQFDHVNPFADHAFRLLEVYNDRKAWYGLRIHPAVGHGGDGAQGEAELFFDSILDKAPPRRAPF